MNFKQLNMGYIYRYIMDRKLINIYSKEKWNKFDGMYMDEVAFLHWLQ